MKLLFVPEVINIITHDKQLLVDEICLQMRQRINLPDIDLNDMNQELRFKDEEVYFDDGIVVYLTGSVEKKYVNKPQDADGSMIDDSSTCVTIDSLAVMMGGDDVECKINGKDITDLIEKIQNQLKETL